MDMRGKMWIKKRKDEYEYSNNKRKFDTLLCKRREYELLLLPVFHRCQIFLFNSLT